jgi:parvulin-like peptidyl-prolyl isomerase
MACVLLAAALLTGGGAGCAPDAPDAPDAPASGVDGIVYPLTVGERPIPMAEYKSYFLKQKSIEEKNYGGEEIWEKEGALERLKSYVLADILHACVVKELALRCGLDPDAETDAKALAGEIKKVMAAEGSEWYIDREALTERLNRIYVKATHICLPIGEGDDPEQRYETAAQIRARAAAGEDFDVLRAQYRQVIAGPEGEESVQVLSREEEVWPPSYEDAAFGLAVGEISDVVYSGGGLYVIKRLALTEADVEERRPGVTSSYYDELYGNLYYEIKSSLEVRYDEAYDRIGTDTLCGS